MSYCQNIFDEYSKRVGDLIEYFTSRCNCRLGPVALQKIQDTVFSEIMRKMSGHRQMVLIVMSYCHNVLNEYSKRVGDLIAQSVLGDLIQHNKHCDDSQWFYPKRSERLSERHIKHIICF